MHCLAGGASPGGVPIWSGLGNLTNVQVPRPFHPSLLHSLSMDAVVIALCRSLAFNFVSSVSGIRLGILVWAIGTEHSNLRCSPIRRVLKQSFIYGIIL